MAGRGPFGDGCSLSALDGAGHRYSADLVCFRLGYTSRSLRSGLLNVSIFFAQPASWSFCKMLFWQIGNGVPRSRHYRSDTGGKTSIQRIIKGSKDGRSRKAPKDHSPMDVAAEGQAADARAGSRLCEEDSRAE
jgi:hypothetical protein